MRQSLVLALTLVLAACTSRVSSPEPSRGAVVPAAPDEAVEAPTGDTLPAGPAEIPEPRDVTFVTSDGVTLGATLSPGSRPDAPAVILVHQIASDRSEWAPLVARLREAPALTVLAIDLRGHGASTQGPAGPLDFHAFDTAAWGAIGLDVRAAAAFLTSRESGLLPNHIAVVGSSLGATAAVLAAHDEGRLDPIVTLSPGRAYHGVDAITLVLALGGRALLAVVAREEADGVDTASAFARITRGEPLIVDGNAHGVALFTAAPETLDRVESFLRERVGAPRGAP